MFTILGVVALGVVSFAAGFLCGNATSDNEPFEGFGEFMSDDEDEPEPDNSDTAEVEDDSDSEGEDGSE